MLSTLSVPMVRRREEPSRPATPHPIPTAVEPRLEYFQKSFQNQWRALGLADSAQRRGSDSPPCHPRDPEEKLQALAWAVSAVMLDRLRRHYRQPGLLTAFLQAQGLDPEEPAMEPVGQILTGNRRVALAWLDLLRALLTAAGWQEHPGFLRWLLYTALAETGALALL